MLAHNAVSLPSMGWRHPFAEMERLARQMDSMANAIFRRPGARIAMPKEFPATNITEDNEKYYIYAELPGMKADDIRLEAAGKKLAISGERKIQTKGENARYHRRERDAGKFSRVIGLSGGVDADTVDAKLVNGLLTVAIAKSAAAKAKQITVKTRFVPKLEILRLFRV